MTPTEAVALCRMARALCPGQHFDEYTPDAWHLVLEDLRLVDCQLALKMLGRKQAFIAPNEVYAEVRRVRNERIAKAGPIEPPPEVESGERDYREWWLETRTAIADGDLIPEDRPANKLVRRKVELAIEGAFQHVPNARAAIHAAKATTCSHGIPREVCKSKHDDEEAA